MLFLSLCTKSSVELKFNKEGKQRFKFFECLCSNNNIHWTRLETQTHTYTQCTCMHLRMCAHIHRQKLTQHTHTSTHTDTHAQTDTHTHRAYLNVTDFIQHFFGQHFKIEIKHLIPKRIVWSLLCARLLHLFPTVNLHKWLQVAPQQLLGLNNVKPHLPKMIKSLTWV